MIILDVIYQLESEAHHPDAPKELAPLVLMFIQRIKPGALELARLVDEWKRLVVELAAMDPKHNVYRYGDVEQECLFCDADLDYASVQHEPDCLWLRAREKCR